MAAALTSRVHALYNGAHPACVAGLQQQLAYSTEVRSRPNLAAMKRGQGGRSSFSGDVVTVFGASGFIGRGVCNRLGKNGSQMVLPYRGDHYKMMRLKVCGDLGQVLFCPYQLTDEESIRRAVKHSNIVINLVGRQYETKNFKFDDVNTAGAARIARICKEMGVERLLYMSTIKARETPDEAFLSGGSRWVRSKYEGELAVRSEFPEAVIVRASDVYGQADSFINHYMSNLRRDFTHGVPLWMKGHYTIKQPIHLTDCVSGIMAALYDPNSAGQTFEAVGPERLTFHNLITYMYHLTSRKADNWNFRITELLLDPITMAKVTMFGKSPWGLGSSLRGINLDRLESESLNDDSDGYPNITELGVTKLKKLHEIMPWEIKPYGYYNYYQYITVDEVPKVPPPELVTHEQERAIAKKRSQGLLGAVGFA